MTENDSDQGVRAVHPGLPRAHPGFCSGSYGLLCDSGSFQDRNNGFGCDTVFVGVRE